MKYILFLLLIVSNTLFCNAPQPNVLIYDDGSIQVNTQIDEYEKPIAGKPLKGSVLITHNKKDKIDDQSFLLGNKPLKVQFVNSTPMTSAGNVIVSIYKFQTPDLEEGIQELPSVSVKISGKRYQSPPLSLEIE